MRLRPACDERVTAFVLLMLTIWLAGLADVSRAATAAENPFARSYINLELTRNYPISFGQNRFIPGHAHPLLGYRHNLDEDWMMGISAQFKIFDRKDPGPDEQDQVAIWAVTHESLYVVRLYHPTYLLAGAKLLYLLPTKGAVLPMQRDTEFAAEIGGALSLTIAHVLDERWMATVRVDRWRGTGSMRFHGLETAVGMSLALP